MSDLTPTPATSRLGALFERVRSAFSPIVQPVGRDPDPQEVTTVSAPASVPSLTPAERIASAAMSTRMDQVPFQEFGADVMPREIAQAGIVLTYEAAVARIEQHMARMPEQNRGEVLALLQSSNTSLALTEPLGPTDPIERLAHEWTMKGVGANAVDRMFGAASYVAKVGEWSGRDTALVEQPYGLRIIDAREEWERRVLEVDGTDLSAEEKALKIEGLGQAPVVGNVALIDHDGVIYQCGSLDRAMLTAEQDIDFGLEMYEYDGHNITDLTTTGWIIPEAGAEYRATFGQSADGFHHLTEISYGGGDREEEWSDAYPSLAEAEAASTKIIDAHFGLEVEEQEIGGHEL